MLAYVALSLATLNLTVRLDREMIDVWDESLYATSALEMRSSGQWAATTFQGELDYFNSKPPLNTWLIATSFEALGVHLVSLRLPSALAAWLTVVVAFVWARSHFGVMTAGLTALVLGSTYPFLYVHAGRTANADAPLALIVTLATVVVWTSGTHRSRGVWLGPLAAAALMLKGPAALAFVGPLVMADVVAARAEGGLDSRWWRTRGIGALAGGLLVAWWAVARYHVDGWRFLGRLVSYDMVGRATSGVEGHDEVWYYYALVLLRHHYEWLGVTVGALALAPSSLPRLRTWVQRPDAPSRLRLTVLAWVVATLVVPTIVPTRLAWYLNPFYPGAAVMTALAIRHAWAAASRRWSRAMLAGLVVTGVLTAEGRMIYRSLAMIDLDRSAQGLLIDSGARLAGWRVFATQCPYPETYLAVAAGATCVVAAEAAAAARAALPGDYWIGPPDASLPDADRVAVNRAASLHRFR
jgi:4-amino-4-deoxy-L-arabinose transferase-like glycosyltransferase